MQLRSIIEHKSMENKYIEYQKSRVKIYYVQPCEYET